jgi:pyruvate carboxylase
MITLTDALEVVEQLTEEDQETLISIIRKRQIEKRRDEIARDAEESIAAYRAGLLPTYTAAEAFAELHRDLQEVEEWRALSLEQAMRGLDDDNLPEYTEADLVEKWQ